MADYIDRQAAIDALEGEVTVTGRANAETVLGYANLICDRIKRLPSADVVEVVRCKECIHNGSFDTDCPIDWAGKDYCSYGERKDGKDKSGRV